MLQLIMNVRTAWWVQIVPSAARLRTQLQVMFRYVINTIEQLKNGYWRTSSTSKELVECDNPDACNGGSDSTDYCRNVGMQDFLIFQGYKGVVCAVCETDYSQAIIGNECIPCKEAQTSTFAISIVLLVLVVGVFIGLGREAAHRCDASGHGNGECLISFVQEQFNGYTANHVS